jgi:hypothetical protein
MINNIQFNKTYQGKSEFWTCLFLLKDLTNGQISIRKRQKCVFVIINEEF